MFGFFAKTLTTLRRGNDNNIGSIISFNWYQLLLTNTLEEIKCKNN